MPAVTAGQISRPQAPPIIQKQPCKTDNKVDSEKIQKALNKLACQVLKKLSDKNSGGSLFLSPISLTPVLGMLLAAMDKHEDRKTFLTQLGIDIGDDELREKGVMDELHAAFGKASKETFQSPTATLSMANAVIMASPSVAEEFSDVIVGSYGGKVISGVDDLVGETNKFVAEETKGMIEEVLSPDEVDNIAMTVVNGTFFQAIWEKSFNVADTTSGEFRCADGSEVKDVLLMRTGGQREHFVKTDGCKVLVRKFESPENGKPLTFTAVLPEDEEALKALKVSLAADEAYLDSLKNRATQGGENGKVMVATTLPRLKVDCEIKNLKEVLEELGYPMNASFNNPKSAGSFEQDYILGLLMQKVTLEVDEVGARVTAATVAAPTRSIVPQIKTFEATRPFLMFIECDGKRVLLGFINNGDCLVHFKPAPAKKLSEKEASEFIQEETAMGCILDKLRERHVDEMLIAKITSKVTEYKCLGIKQTVVNLSDQDVTFDEHNKLCLDGKTVAGPYTPEDCVTCVWSENGQLFYLDCDKGTTNDQGLVAKPLRRERGESNVQTSHKDSPKLPPDIDVNTMQRAKALAGSSAGYKNVMSKPTHVPVTRKSQAKEGDVVLGVSKEKFQAKFSSVLNGKPVTLALDWEDLQITTDPGLIKKLEEEVRNFLQDNISELMQRDTDPRKVWGLKNVQGFGYGMLIKIEGNTLIIGGDAVNHLEELLNSPPDKPHRENQSVKTEEEPSASRITATATAEKTSKKPVEAFFRFLGWRWKN